MSVRAAPRVEGGPRGWAAVDEVESACSALYANEISQKVVFGALLRARPRRAAGMDSWGWAILLAAVTAVSAMLLMALYDEISRRKWLAKSGAERCPPPTPRRTKRLD